MRSNGRHPWRARRPARSCAGADGASLPNPGVNTDVMPMRAAMYHALLGETMDGPAAARAGLVNESVPLTQLEAKVTEVAQKLLAESLNGIRRTFRQAKRLTGLQRGVGTGRNKRGRCQRRILVVLAALILFGVRVGRLITLLARARYANRTDHIDDRIGEFFLIVLGQGGVLRDPIPGIAHFFTFWGFIIIQFGFLNLALGAFNAFSFFISGGGGPSSVSTRTGASGDLSACTCET